MQRAKHMQKLMQFALLTRFALFPLNDQLMTWSVQAPPPAWRALRPN